jgi:anti-sigma B factor antagonist
MKIAVAQDDGVTVVRLSGRMDALGLEQVAIPLNNAIAARKALAVVDLSGVEFMTSMGLWQFFGAARAQRRHGGTLVLAAPQASVQAVLDGTRMEHVMPVYATVDEALAALRAVAVGSS